MSKYIRIIKDFGGVKKPVVARINTCNYCPLMLFNPNISTVNCRGFKNESYDNIIDGFVMNNIGHQLLDKINIPIWCKLPNNIFELTEIQKTYFVKEHTFIVSREAFLAPSTIIDSSFLSNFGEEVKEDSTDFLSFMKKNAKESIKNSFKDFKFDFNDLDNDRIIESKIIVGEKCSLCGEEKTEITRNKNIGMCDECFNINKDNDEQIKIAFINNFRLKRGVKLIINNLKMV